MDSEQEFFTVAQVAAKCGVCEHTVRRWMAAGRRSEGRLGIHPVVYFPAGEPKPGAVRRQLIPRIPRRSFERFVSVCSTPTPEPHD